MAKNVVICCDGTANQFAQDRTNVVKLAFTLKHDSRRQVAYYHPGLGTMEPSGALTTTGRALTKLLGLAFGYGFEHDIADAYTFLMHNFRRGDRVFLFGFSRGAYTVRALAALLHLYGLIRPGNEPLIPYAIRMMTAISHSRRSGTSAMMKEYLDLARQFRDHFSIQDCRPHFVGLWDTVASVGWYETPVQLPYTSNNPDIAIARHAISIDERRAFFRANLWHPTANGGPKDLQQVWFPGTHSDVGGGFPESESGLSKITLEWMLREAIAAGLECHTGRVELILGRMGLGGYVEPDAHAILHESLVAAWPLAEFIPKRHYNWTTRREERRPNLFRRRTIPSGSLIHQSAYDRGGDYAARLPPDAVRVPW